MSKSVATFNGLNAAITREEVKQICKQAKDEGQMYLYNRLTAILEQTKNKDCQFQRGHEAIEQVAEYDLPGIEPMPDYIGEDEFTGLNKAVSPSDIYQMITDKMLAMIDEASGDGYERKWKTEGYLTPFNFVSKKPYRGINFFLLKNFDPFHLFFNPFFLTFNQVDKLKGKVKKGSTGYPVIYFTQLYKFNYVENGENKEFGTYNPKKAFAWLQKNSHIIPELTNVKTGASQKMDIQAYMNQNILPILKYYNIFNGADIEGIDFDLENWKEGYVSNKKEDNNDPRIEIADAIVAAYPKPAPPIFEDQAKRAFYSVNKDEIHLPPYKNFDTGLDYYRTLFHELTHSTGSKNRLKRKFGRKDTPEYAREELVAEFGAVFLSAQAGILWYQQKNHAEYLKGWKSALKHIKEDNRLLMRAASAGQKAAEFILQPDAEGNPKYLKEIKPKVKVKKVKPKAKPKKYKSSSLQNLVDKGVLEPKKQKTKLSILEGKLENLKRKRIDRIKKGRNQGGTAGSFNYSVESINHDIKEIENQIEKLKPKNKPTPKPKRTTSKTVIDLPVKSIKTSEKRFQNRAKLNETVVNNIVENFVPTQFDAIVVWTDPKDKKVYLLAGHHRLEAFKRMGKRTIPVRFADKDYPTEKEAIKYARQLSNANRTLETPLERAKIYRQMIEAGETVKAINEAAAIEGRNRNYILNLASLNESGPVVEALIRFEGITDKQNEKALERISDWIGEARRKNPQLTNAHESEMFKFLQDESASKRIKTKVQFLQQIHAIAGGFDFDANKGLNLKRTKYKSTGEEYYDQQYNNIKDRISDVQDEITALKSRFIDPSNKQFIHPDSKDYEAVKKRADNKIAQLNTEIRSLQKELVELAQNKSKLITAGQNQTALFGAKSRRKKKQGLKSPGLDELIDQMEIIEPKITEARHISGENGRPLLSGKVRSITHTTQANPMFRINGETARFLQAIEKKPVESVVVTLDGPQGAGKTTALYKFMNDFATAGNRCLFASLEEHPSSNLATEKRDLYISRQAQQNIDVIAEFDSYQEFSEIAKNYDAIFIDSWQKLVRMIGTIRLDEDVRKKFDSKVFFVIFQQTTTGRTKGGAEIVFDGDVIIKLEKTNSFAENYAYFDKNRYTTVPIEKIRYYIADGNTVIEGEERSKPKPKPIAEPQEPVPAIYDFEVY